MRRKANRILRYFFPVAIISIALVLLKNSSIEKVDHEVTSKKQVSEEVVEKTQAKMLRMVSHNPQTQARLLVNANKAIQYDDKITLNNPTGTFEKSDGSSSLKSFQASYYEIDHEVHFFEKVSFDHHSGLIATTKHAILNTQTQDISGSQGIKACHQENTITAQSYEIHTGKNVMCFSGDVCLNVSRKKS